MVQTNKGFIFFTFLAVLCITGCDAVMPKEKTVPGVKMEEKATTTVPAEEKLPKDVLVKVGDWTLTVNEFNERVKNIKQVVTTFDEKNVEAKKMLIEELVRQQLMVYEAREKKLNETKEFHATIKDFENNVLVQELVSGLTKDIQVTEDAAREYYDKNPDVFVKPVEKKISEIVVATETEARDILVQILQGADFANIAKERSSGKTAAEGGELGFLTKGTFEKMDKAMESLNKGGVSAVLQGPDGFYVVRADDVRGGDKVSFDEVKADLIKGLTAQKQQQVVLEKMAEIARKVKVSVNAELLEDKTGE